MNYQLTAAARAELSAAQDHYESERRGLGARFLDAVAEQFQLCLEQPTYAGRLSAGVYFRRVHKFPYLVIYQVMTDQILIIAVSHERRDPQHWQQRLPEA